MKVMKKVLEKGAEYIKNESERLGRILSKPDATRGGLVATLCCYCFLDGDISLKKSDELTKKRNVLKKFEL